MAYSESEPCHHAGSDPAPNPTFKKPETKIEKKAAPKKSFEVRCRYPVVPQRLFFAALQ
jgi:hypothetical protein